MNKVQKFGIGAAIILVFASAFSLFYGGFKGDKNVVAGRSAYMRFYNKFLPNPSSLNIVQEKYTQDKKKVTWDIIIESESVFHETVRDTDQFVTYGAKVLLVNGQFYTDIGD